jgi:hypothetical protein
MPDLDLSAEQRRLLRVLAGSGYRLFRDFDGAYWLHPSESRRLPESVHAADARQLIDAGLLVVEPVPNFLLGDQFVPATEEI